jgi:hypothetical protein
MQELAVHNSSVATLKTAQHEHSTDAFGCTKHAMVSGLLNNVSRLVPML